MASILVVDDRAINREFLVTLLGYFEHEMLQAADGAEALALATARHPDLIITDVLMPVMDGVEFVCRLHADPALAGIPVIFYTATYRLGDAWQMARDCGVDTVIGKPAAPQAILDAVAAKLGAPPQPVQLLQPAASPAPGLPAGQLSTWLANLPSLPQPLQPSHGTVTSLSLRLAALLELGLEMGAERDVDRLLYSFIHAACDIMNAQHAAAGLVERHGDGGHVAMCGLPEAVRPLLAAPGAAGVLGQLMAKGELLRLCGAEAATAALPAGHPPVRALIALPLRSPTRRYGWLYFADKLGSAAGSADFSDEDEQIAIILASKLSQACENLLLVDEAQRYAGELEIEVTARKEAEQLIRHAAQHDPLTGLPNRALLYEFGEHLLPAMQRGKAQAAFLFVDLDRFKPINDTYGHEVGDAVLKEVAARLTAGVRGEDLVGRLGGDEFVAVLANIHGEDDAARIAFHILDRLGQPYVVDGVELLVSPSIGISLFPQDGTTVEVLIKCADVAMYQAKQSGRNNFQFFQPELKARSEGGLRIENRLHRALEFGEFELYLQPVIELATGATVAAEALVRWPAIDLPPTRFIPLAEMAGFMPRLGAWIVQEACRLRCQWRRRGLPAFPVSVNISPLQFRQRDFLSSLVALMESAGVQTGELMLEITESVLDSNVDEVVRTLHAIREAGALVALDEFGTGVSSLSYLTQAPFDVVKLDRSLVREVGRDRRSAIVGEGIIALANSLDLVVVASGIESEETLAFLKTRHCRQGQGFLFSRPLAAREFESWYRRRAA